MKDPNWRKCVLCGDSKDIIKHIPDHSVDFILTDPPYNIGGYSTGNIPLPGRTAMNNDIAPWDHIDFHPEEWADEFIRILKPDGNLFIFTSYHQIGRWHECLDRKFDTTNFMVWHKTNPAPKIFKAGFLNSCEMVFTCWNKKHTWNFLSQAEMHNFIESPICMRPERLADPKHPAQKPVKILEKMIRIASNEGDIIFDPFMGVGSTGVAAMNLGRKFIGIELNPTYCEAAERRVNEALDKYMNENKTYAPTMGEADRLCEPPAYDYGQEVMKIQPSPLDAKPRWAEDWQQKASSDKHTGKAQTARARKKIVDGRLKPLLKWPGGKEKELKFILPLAPKDFDNYYEPFVGGGAVYAAFAARHYYINDKSEELIHLYRYISSRDADFFAWAEAIDASWTRLLAYAKRDTVLGEVYLKLREDSLSAEDLSVTLHAHFSANRAAIDDCLHPDITMRREECHALFLPTMKRKLLRMKKIETERGLMPPGDIMDNIETAYMGALYTFFRALYNDKQLGECNVPLHTALFLYLRYNAYSGMFRYNDKGDFNVPYGGISYNHKTLMPELDYYRSPELHARFEHTTMAHLDFEEFLRSHQPGENDFIFLDPPYDSEFSTYAGNDFTPQDQQRLAHYLLHECRGKWMMVIKATPLILSLYENQGLTIRSFDKTYQVSFMNRNNRDVQHLVIMNYVP